MYFTHPAHTIQVISTEWMKAWKWHHPNSYFWLAMQKWIWNGSCFSIGRGILQGRGSRESITFVARAIGSVALFYPRSLSERRQKQDVVLTVHFFPLCVCCYFLEILPSQFFLSVHISIFTFHYLVATPTFADWLISLWNQTGCHTTSFMTPNN